MGQSTATFNADTGFTVTDITGLDENNKADNGTEVTFKVTAADSKTPKVTCNGTALTADDSGIYKFTLKGDASVSIKDSTATTDYGTQDAPLTVTEANDLILAETGKTNKKFTKKSIFVKGTLTTDNGYNSKYKNYTFTISDGSKTLKIQRAVLGSGVSSIKKGDTVILSGYGEYYNGCCMYPNGSTKPTVVAIVTA